jgi:hypothetical protein
MSGALSPMSDKANGPIATYRVAYLWMLVIAVLFMLSGLLWLVLSFLQLFGLFDRQQTMEPWIPWLLTVGSLAIGFPLWWLGKRRSRQFVEVWPDSLRHRCGGPPLGLGELQDSTYHLVDLSEVHFDVLGAGTKSNVLLTLKFGYHSLELMDLLGHRDKIALAFDCWRFLGRRSLAKDLAQIEQYGQVAFGSFRLSRGEFAFWPEGTPSPMEVVYDWRVIRGLSIDPWGNVVVALPQGVFGARTKVKDCPEFARLIVLFEHFSGIKVGRLP